jgi:hypothetical protein
LVGSGRRILLRYNLGIRLEELTKPTKNFNQDSRSPGPTIEQGPPKYIYIKEGKYIVQISGSHGNEYEDDRILGCCVMLSGRK